MSPASRAEHLVSLLRARKLDRTLTSVAPPAVPAQAPWLMPALNQVMRGGLPRGQMSEITGPVSSGRTSLAWAGLAAATQRGERVALIDTFDRFDPVTAVDAGLVLPQTLWVRGQALSKTAGAVDPGWVPGVRAVQGPGTLLERTIDRAIKALTLIVQSGVCTFVVIDLVDVPVPALASIPRATWLRVQRIIEGSATAVLLLAPVPVARSAGGFSIAMGAPASRLPALLRNTPGSEAERVTLPPPASRLPTPLRNMPGSEAERVTLPPPGSRLPALLRNMPGSEAEGMTLPEVMAVPIAKAVPEVMQSRWRSTHDRSRRLAGLSTHLRASSPRGFVGEITLKVLGPRS
ncbi:MAG: hypothetical protein IT178_03795 [Acidobacteria bacterium]|nr:hypothetical protein [Acidobacteriota bacterium]